MMDDSIVRCEFCGLQSLPEGPERHMITCQRIGDRGAIELDDVTLRALQVGRALFGGITPEGASWDLCQRVARAVTRDAEQVPNVDRRASAQRAFTMCEQFNKDYPKGTAGVVPVGDRRVPTTLEGPAMVFPNPILGELVMAWFGGVGWRPIHDFTKQDKPSTIDDDLVAIGIQMNGQNKRDLAFSLFQAAVSHNGKNALAWNEMAIYRASKGQYNWALNNYGVALEHLPENGGIYHNRSVALRAVGRLEEALADTRRAAELLPSLDHISLTTAQILDDMGEIEQSIAILDKRIAKNPQDYVAHYNKSLVLLAVGRLKEGWEEFEWRLSQPACSSHYSHFSVRRAQADKESIRDKTVLIWPEQGIGDEIMTASMFNDVIDVARHVTILCSDRLIPLFKRSFPRATIDRRPDGHIVDLFRRQPLHVALLPQSVRTGYFDYQMSQCDVGRMFRPSMEAFPKPGASYLMPDAEKTMAMMSLLERRYPAETLVGIAWHSKLNINIGMHKGVDLAALAPILKTPGVRFISLQYGDCSEEIAAAEVEFGVKIETVPEVDQMKDMDAFAALVASLDLVITVSNTTAHVAGSIGTPCWLLTPEGPGRLWYWFRKIVYSPWYTSMVMYRQPAASQWQSIIQSAADDLARWTATWAVV